MARMSALISCLPETEQEAARSSLSQPNNILGLEYEKALLSSHSEIQGLPIKRQGQGYHDFALDGDTEFASATAIRNSLLPGEAFEKIKEAIPSSGYQILTNQPAYLSEEDFSQILHYALLQKQADGYDAFADCPDYLSKKIQNKLSEYIGFTEFCKSLKSKDLTYTRIQRCLLHILLNIKKSDYSYWEKHGYVPYLRILGFRKDSAPLLCEIKKHCKLPLILRGTDAKKLLLNIEQKNFWAQQLLCDNIYQVGLTARTKQILPNEYQRTVLTV